MAWIYLKCSTGSTYSQESEECPSHCKNGLDPSHTAKSTHTVKRCYSKEWPTGQFARLPYGTTSHHFRVILFPHSWISFTEVAHARDSALQDLRKAWKMSEADCFTRCCVWPKKSSPRSYSLKTYPQLPPGEDWWLLKRLPRWGMIAAGVLYPLRPLERPTKEKDGSYLPTPTARATPDCPSERKRKSPSLNCILNQKNGSYGLKTNPRYVEWMMGYPLGWTELKPLEMP